MGKRPRIQPITRLNQSHTPKQDTHEPDRRQVFYVRPELLRHLHGVSLYVQDIIYTQPGGEPGNTRDDVLPEQVKDWRYLLKVNKITVSGKNITSLFAELRYKRANQHQIDAELLTLDTGLEVGLEEDCIRHFCHDNDLDPESSITRSDLRRRVVARRALNLAQYRAGLARVKIVLGGAVT